MDATEMLIALEAIAKIATWNECATAEPQIRLSKADISNQLDGAVRIARDAVAKAKGGA